MSNKTKGWLMLSPIFTALIGFYIYIMGWFGPVFMISGFILWWYLCKAVELIHKK